MSTQTPQSPDAQPPFPPPPGASAPPVPPKRRRILVLVLISVVATLVALGAVAFAGYEAGRASNAAQPTPTGGTTPPARPTPTAQPTDQPTDGITPTPNAAPSDINPSAPFTPAYQSQELKLRPADSCTQISIDLDEPRVNPSKGADFLLHSCNERQTFQFGDSTASVVDNPNATPAECADSIRTSSLSSNAALPIQATLVVCIATSLPAALEQGIKRKIAVVVVKAIAADETVTLVVSAWTVPG